MDNQHRKINGYRELNQEEIELMNEIKDEGKKLQVLIRKIKAHNAIRGWSEDNIQEGGTDWLGIGETDLQKGLMFLTRSVAKPTFF